MAHMGIVFPSSLEPASRGFFPFSKAGPGGFPKLGCTFIGIR